MSNWMYQDSLPIEDHPKGCTCYKCQYDPIRALIEDARAMADEPFVPPTPEEDAMVEEYLARHANDQEPDDDPEWLEGSESYEPSAPSDDYGFGV